jgi:hypothetical protein
MKSIFLVILIIFSFSACLDKKTVVKKEIPPPVWISKPYMNGKIGAVGSAYPHFKGKTFQRRLAISRGLDELAQQSGVNIKSTIKTSQERQGSSTKTGAQIYTVQNSANETIKAHIEAVWTDKRTQELYIWLLQD